MHPRAVSVLLLIASSAIAGTPIHAQAVRGAGGSLSSFRSESELAAYLRGLSAERDSIRREVRRVSFAPRASRGP